MATILVVDDDAETRDLLTRFLERVGHHALPAANGWEALLALDASAVDLILLDMMMPGMDGPTFLRVLRACREQRGTAVVVVSALDPERVASKLGSLAVAEVLPKKDLANLLRAVERHAGRTPYTRRTGGLWRNSLN